jgi:hypothetical protein
MCAEARASALAFTLKTDDSAAQERKRESHGNSRGSHVAKHFDYIKEIHSCTSL